jgi:hypothetical protein
MRYTNLLLDNPLNNTAIQMDKGMKTQGGSGMIVQNYCQAIIAQPFRQKSIQV